MAIRYPIYPIYLLLDTSSLMYGKPIQAVRDGVNMIVEALMSEPTALDRAWLSVITFSETAEEKVPLTPITAFNLPRIEVSGRRTIGGALNFLVDRIKRDVWRRKNENERGDWRPSVLLLTSGEPTNAHREYNLFYDVVLDRLLDVRFQAFVVLDVGKYADDLEYESIVSVVNAEEAKYLRLEDVDAICIKKCLGFFLVS